MEAIASPLFFICCNGCNFLFFDIPTRTIQTQKTPEYAGESV